MFFVARSTEPLERYKTIRGRVEQLDLGIVDTLVLNDTSYFGELKFK